MTTEDWDGRDEYVIVLPEFERNGPFRYFDLPFEIGYNVLELLLVRGPMALTQDLAIRERFPHRGRERLQWVKSLP